MNNEQAVEGKLFLSYVSVIVSEGISAYLHKQ